MKYYYNVSMNKKYIFILTFTLILLGLGISYNFYQKIFGKSVLQNEKIYITSTDNLEEVNAKISPVLKNPKTFLWLAIKKKFTKPKAGMYLLKKGMSLNDVINLLQSGNQTPIKISFNNQDTLEKLAGRIAKQIEADSISILNTMKDSLFLKEQNFTKKSALSMYIPNTYEFYWNTSPEKFRSKMLKEYHRFWNEIRLNNAKKQGLTKEDVIILASIVQKETAQISERPIVAGLYLNRLRNDWPLQADPTLIFALKEKKGQHFIVKRVLNIDKEINSPYNTYKHKGLPPTLISMPDISSIDAVLNAKKHHYFYMCASINRIGFHEFTNSLHQHNKNAQKYQHWIRKKGINR